MYIPDNLKQLEEIEIEQERLRRMRKRHEREMEMAEHAADLADDQKIGGYHE